MKYNQEEFLSTLQQLCDVADRDQKIKFEFIRSFSEFLYVRKLKKEVKKIINTFDVLTFSCIRAYTSLIEKDGDDINLIVSASSCLRYKEFYEQNLAVLDNMLSEYRAYIKHFHTFTQNVIFGNYRTDEELIDFRMFF